VTAQYFGYPVHPAADEFPMLDEARLSDLAADIAAHGLKVKIQLLDGQIIDGRNRARACVIAGVAPEFERIACDNPYRYVWSLNGERRDLGAIQHDVIFLNCQRGADALDAALDAAEAKRREGIAKAATDREFQGNQYTKKVVDGRNRSAHLPISETKPKRQRDNSHRSVAALAEVAGSKPGTMEKAKTIVSKGGKVAQEVAMGTAKPTDALRQIRKETLVAKLDDLAAREVIAPTGLFDVIVIDPPWPMQKIERDERPNQTAFDYPTMSEEELTALRLPADTDCHVWLWTTHKFLPMALRLLDAWSLKYVCCFVWHKPGGFQPVGLPQYNCEMALYARKGAPKFIDTKALPTCFNAPRGAHSEKPEEFYDMVRRVTGGRRIDMFSRRAITGFTTWGQEAPQ
jgi:N6-adenosine-specific RNA methylase IME4